MSDWTKVTIRKDIAERGKIQAAAENRSLANYVEWLVQKEAQDVGASEVRANVKPKSKLATPEEEV